MSTVANRTSPGQLIAATLLSWVTMLTVGMLAWVSLVGLRGQHAADEPLVELAFLFLLVMAVPFAFVLLAVYLPVLWVAGRLLGRRPWGLASVGGGTGPLAGLVLGVAGHFLYSTRSTIGADLEAIVRDPLSLAPWLFALVVGGVVLGLGVVWALEPRSNPALEPTARATSS